MNVILKEEFERIENDKLESMHIVKGDSVDYKPTHLALIVALGAINNKILAVNLRILNELEILNHRMVDKL